MTTVDGMVATTSRAGRTSISARALQRVVEAVAASALGVEPRHVGADVTDDGGSLALAVNSPIRIASLDRIESNPGLVARGGGTILARAAEAQQTIHTEVETITGSRISRVNLRLTGANVTSEGRVT